VYRLTAGEPVFVLVAAPTDEDIQALLHKIITHIARLLTRRYALVEENDSTLMASDNSDTHDGRRLKPLLAAACPYIIDFGPRAGPKVPTTRGPMPRDRPLCADESGMVNVRRGS
jgi:hypothetical protein